MRADEATLLDIAGAAQRILTFIDDVDRDTFLSDAEKQSAVLFQLLVIGEATKRLSDEFHHLNSSIPWRQASGMRDRLIHGYDAIDFERVWNTVSIDISDLLARLEPLLPVNPE